jgi:hypothetical protein
MIRKEIWIKRKTRDVRFADPLPPVNRKILQTKELREFESRVDRKILQTKWLRLKSCKQMVCGTKVVKEQFGSRVGAGWMCHGTLIRF